MGWEAAIPPGNSSDDFFVTDATVKPIDECATATSLLARATAQQPDAWEKMVRVYGPLVYRWCRRWGLQRSDAENVGQEVFLRLSQNLSRFRRARPGDTFRGWLHSIARNCYVDFVRRREPALCGGLCDRVPDPATAEESAAREAAWRREDDALLYRRVVELIRSEFSDRDWRAFHRVVADEALPAQVAAELQVSVNVVYLARSRVLRRVRETLNELNPGIPAGDGGTCEEH